MAAAKITSHSTAMCRHQDKVPSLTYLALNVLILSDSFKSFDHDIQQELIHPIGHVHDLQARSKIHRLSALFSSSQKLKLLKYEFKYHKAISGCLPEKYKQALEDISNLDEAKLYLHKTFQDHKPFRWNDWRLKKWQAIIAFLVRWKVQPFQAFGQEIDAMIWAALWNAAVDEQGVANQYEYSAIDDPLLASLLTNTVYKPDESEEEWDDGTLHSPPRVLGLQREKNYMRRYYGNRFSPLSFACGFTSTASPLRFELLYSIGERPWGHELIFWFMECRTGKYQDKEMEVMTKLLCEKDCVEVWVKGYRGRGTLDELFLCPNSVFQSFFQYFPPDCYQHLKFPIESEKNLLYAAAWNPSKDRLIFALRFLNDHKLLTKNLTRNIDLAGIDTEHKEIINEHLSNLDVPE